MKIGIHLSVFTKSWDEDVLKYIPRVKEIGYDSVEIPLLNPNAFDVKRARKLLKEHNLSVSCGTGLNPLTDITSVEDSIRRNGINHLKKCVDICADLGAKTLNGVIHSPWGMMVPRSDQDKLRTHGVKSLIEVAKYSEKKNITLCLELLNKYESSYLNTIEEGVELIKEVGSSFVKLHVDTFHSNIEEANMYRAIRNNIDHIGHIHFADNHRGTPGTGQIKFDKIMKIVKESNYQNHIVVECFVLPNCEVGNDVNIWRKIESSSEQMAIDSFKYINHLVKE